MGLPVRHHVVVYLLAKAQEDHRTLQGRLKLQNQEVDAAAWIDEATATEVAASDDFGQSRKVPQRYFRSVYSAISQTLGPVCRDSRRVFEHFLNPWYID